MMILMTVGAGTCSLPKFPAAVNIFCANGLKNNFRRGRAPSPGTTGGAIFLIAFNIKLLLGQNETQSLLDVRVIFLIFPDQIFSNFSLGGHFVFQGIELCAKRINNQKKTVNPMVWRLLL